MLSSLTPVSFERHRHTRAPMLWALAAFASGIISGIHAWRPAAWWAAATLAFVFSSFYLLRNRIWMPRALALAALALLGALNIQLRPPDSPDLEILHYATGEELQFTAHVTRPTRTQNARVFLDVETEQITADDQTRPLRANLRLNLYQKQNHEAPALSYGARIHFAAKLHPPRNFAIPEPSTTRDTFTPRESPRSLPPTSTRLKFSQVFPALALNRSAPAFTRA